MTHNVNSLSFLPSLPPSLPPSFSFSLPLSLPPSLSPSLPPSLSSLPPSLPPSRPLLSPSLPSSLPQLSSSKWSPKSDRKMDSSPSPTKEHKRRKSDGEIGSPVRHKPPTPHMSHSTTSSPVASRKSEGAPHKRDPSPTPSSGESEASSSISAGPEGGPKDTSTPISDAKSKSATATYSLGEKVSSF